MKQNGTTNKREIKQKHAVVAWRETGGNITRLCEKIEINRKTFYEWLKDPSFEELISNEECKLNDDIKNVLIDQALEGNLRAITYYLDHKHPEFGSNGSSCFFTDKTIPILYGASVGEIAKKMNVEFIKDKDTNG